jgi:hypothetical protein
VVHEQQTSVITEQARRVRDEVLAMIGEEPPVAARPIASRRPRFRPLREASRVTPPRRAEQSPVPC